jgi:DNA-binding XRE family transcriptional regulator
MNRSEKAGLQQQVGTRIAMAREIAGLTQKDLALRVGIGRTQIVNLEAGRSDTGVTTLVRIARAIGIKTARLIP